MDPAERRASPPRRRHRGARKCVRGRCDGASKGILPYWAQVVSLPSAAEIAAATDPEIVKYGVCRHGLDGDSKPEPELIERRYLRHRKLHAENAAKFFEDLFRRIASMAERMRTRAPVHGQLRTIDLEAAEAAARRWVYDPVVAEQQSEQTAKKTAKAAIPAAVAAEVAAQLSAAGVKRAATAAGVPPSPGAVVKTPKGKAAKAAAKLAAATGMTPPPPTTPATAPSPAPAPPTPGPPRPA